MNRTINACGWCGVMVLAGCAPRAERVGVLAGELPVDLPLPSAVDVVERFEPVTAVVHPLTRFEGTGDSRRVVLHVQLSDSKGHDLKWPGAARAQVAGGPVAWVDLTDPNRAAAAFDSISRCYVVRLEAPGSGPVEVKVRWVQRDANGSLIGLDAQRIVQ